MSFLCHLALFEPGLSTFGNPQQRSFKTGSPEPQGLVPPFLATVATTVPPSFRPRACGLDNRSLLPLSVNFR